jgi:hypothetical protein
MQNHLGFANSIKSEGVFYTFDKVRRQNTPNRIFYDPLLESVIICLSMELNLVPYLDDQVLLFS